jgi:hypothetical protein
MGKGGLVSGPVIGSLNSRSCSIDISASRAALKASAIDRTSECAGAAMAAVAD